LRFAFLRGASVLLVLACTVEARELRVCADPNNLPFSNAREQGFENKLVEIVARELGATVTYVWWAQRRGFVRNTIKAGLCDLLPGAPPGLQGLRTTTPYYASTYAFVTRAGEGRIASFDDPRLQSLIVGVQLVGDDGANTPPAHELAERGIIANVRGYSLYGDYARPDPPSHIVEAVASGEIDVAVVWGPLAGYFAARQAIPLDVTPVDTARLAARLPMTFEIAMAVRKDNEILGKQVEAALRRRAKDVEAVLAAYNVPRLPLKSSMSASR
jgi:mxaJ protein